MSDVVLKKFGKYFLLDRVGEGGMADIFRARGVTQESNGRLLVIKRIQAAHHNNAEFLQMFKSEVQVTMRFTHPNIVQLYESGEENGQQYIAMEWVDGKNLRQLLNKLGKKQMILPISASCFVVEQTAAGLHYAHTFKDRITGESLNVVHRDVSPQNILVSYDGNIKVIDFGIAKANTNGEATRAGVIKGKLSYLSPEQVMGEVLDARSDIFALGIVLWELLTGKRLFVAEGENEFQVLKMIESCSSFVKPPSTFNPEVSKELDDIVMKSLSRDVKKRYQSGEEFARALRKLLAVQYSDFGPSDLSVFIKKLFHDAIVDDRKQIQQLNAQAEELIALGASRSLSLSGEEKSKEQTRVASYIGDKFDKSQLSSADKLEVAGQAQRQMKVSRPKQPTQTGATPPHRRIPAHFNSSNNGDLSSPVSSSFGLLKVMFSLGVLGVLAFFSYPYFSNQKKQDEPLLSRTLASSSKMVALKFRVFPDGDLSKTKITVNAQPVDLMNNKIEVPVGDLLEVVVVRSGFVSYRKEFTIKEAELADQKEWYLDVKLEPMVYGTLTLSTKPALADVIITSLETSSSSTASKPLVLKTPIYREKLPAGNYKVLIRNDILGVEKTFQIEIQEGQEVNYLDQQLDTKK